MMIYNVVKGFAECPHIFGLRVHLVDGRMNLICVSCGITEAGTVQYKERNL